MKNEHKILISDELIVRYLTGEASPPEAEALHDWLEMPDNRSHFEMLENAWAGAHPPKAPRPVDRDRAWETIKGRMNGGRVVVPERSVRGFMSVNGLGFKIAASLVIALAAGLFAYVRFKNDFAVNDAVTPVHRTASRNIEEERLPDHTVVILNRGSAFTYPEKFGAHSREVTLHYGEMFFRVATDPEKPFIIHTDIGDIRVVGTAFNVILRGDSLEVSVEEGKVLLSTASSTAYVKAGDTGTVLRHASAVQVAVADQNTWGYATRKFVFKDAPLYKVFESIEKSYPYSIKMSNKAIGNCKLTATFDHVSAEYMLTLIAETLNFEVTKNDSVFAVEGEGCP